MDFEYKGANCVVLNTKNATVVIDPKLSLVGLKDVIVKDAIQVATAADFVVPNDSQRLMIEGPGEYEVADVSIRGIAATKHVDGNDVKDVTMYHIDMANVRVGVIGHVAANLTDEQLEKFGTIDILIIPVGGSGYTLDAHDAAALTRRIGPKVVIPTHYADNAAKYEVPQAELEPFAKELSAPREETAKFKVKNGALPEVLTLVELKRS